MSEVSKSAKLNMREVSMVEFKSFVKKLIRSNMFKKPVLCLGKSGIGKTESIIQLAKEENIGYVELRLVNYTETDLIGIPSVEAVEGPNGAKTLVTKWAQMGRLPIAERDGEKGILVLDEITSAIRTVRAAAYQLMDTSRSVGDYKLPEGWIIVALGNGPEDGGVYEGLEAAFISRCYSMRVDPDLKSWKKWAIDAQTHPAVIGFLDFQPKDLWNMNLDTEYGAEAYPCPRGWAALSDLLKNFEQLEGNGKRLETSDVAMYASAAVGETTGDMFAAFYEMTDEAISFDEVASGNCKVDISRMNKQIMYIQIQSIVYGVAQLMKSCNNNYDDATMVKVANCLNFAMYTSEKDLNLGYMLMTDMINNISELKLMFLVKIEQLEKYCPNIMNFFTKNRAIYDQIKAN